MKTIFRNFNSLYSYFHFLLSWIKPNTLLLVSEIIYLLISIKIVFINSLTIVGYIYFFIIWVTRLIVVIVIFIKSRIIIEGALFFILTIKLNSFIISSNINIIISVFWIPLIILKNIILTRIKFIFACFS